MLFFLPSQPNRILFSSVENSAFWEFSNNFPALVDIDEAIWPTIENYIHATKFPNHPERMEEIRLIEKPTDILAIFR
jgi:predicted NAD-dependent protein-ADP-ribosyltransferase YbiA (DUF1768 family)